MPRANAEPKDGRTNRYNDGVASSLSDVFVIDGNVCILPSGTVL
jgi:hypothetical protein